MLEIRKASAGSGKTYTLTGEYLRLLLGWRDPAQPDAPERLRPIRMFADGKAHGRILAVTFTNKATEEMTARIIKELQQLAEMPDTPDPAYPDSPYLDGFLKLFRTDRVTLKAHAAAALTDLLLNFSTFNVSTIDSFFQRVLSTFSRELDLPPATNVELDDSYALSVAVNEMLDSINKPEDPPVTDEERRRAAERRRLSLWLKLYLDHHVSAGGRANLFLRGSNMNRELIKHLRAFLTEKYKLNRQAIDSYLAEPERLTRFLHKISGSRDLSPQLKEQIELTLSIAGPKMKKTPNLKGVLEAALAGEKLKITDAVARLADEPEKIFSKNAPGAPEEITAVAVAVQGLLDYVARVDLYDFITSYAFELGLFGIAQRFLQAYLRDNESILLSETGDLLNRIIDEQETPFIYERMGNAIRHYLIDEFQDTSEMQWKNLSPLVMESLSSGNYNLIIGDEKQCIYRFRNSSPELLGSRVEESVASRSYPIDIKGSAVEENTNWRSSAPVVRFNNTLFRNIATLMDADTGDASHSVARTYAGIVQQIAPKNADTPGRVRVEFLSSVFSPESGVAERYASLTDTAQAREAVDALMLERLTAAIVSQLQAGYAPADIAVLVRTSGEGRQVIEHLMAAMNDPEKWPLQRVGIMSADSMAISISGAVRMIVDVLRLCSQPARILTPSGKDGKTVEEENPVFRRYRLLHRYELALYETVEEVDAETGEQHTRYLTPAEALERAIEATSPDADETEQGQRNFEEELQWLTDMDSPSLIETTERIIGRFLNEEVRRRETVYITAFQDLVMDFSEHGENNILSFLEWWDRTGRNTNVTPPEGLDAINVLTIHKSKGLEYKCVHVLGADSPTVKYNDRIYRTSLGWYTLDPAYFPEIDPADVPPLMPLPNDRRNSNRPMLAREAMEWEAEQRLDTLNVFYVAFTRAVSELTVYLRRCAAFPLPSARSAGSEKCFADYILEGINLATPEAVSAAYVGEAIAPWLAALAPCAGFGDDGVYRLEYGAPTKKSVAKETARESAPLDLDLEGVLDGYPWSDHISVLAETDFEDMVEFDYQNPRHFGIFLHAVLSRTEVVADLPGALDRMSYRYRLSPQEKEDSRRLLEKAFSNPAVGCWFAPGAVMAAERAIVENHRGETRTRRPDRIVRMPDGSVMVIDYKFGEYNEQTNRKYLAQVRRYMKLLSRMGYEDVKGALWYLAEDKIISVD